MNYTKYVVQKFTKSSTVHKVVGNDSMDGILQCGFLRKDGPTNNDIDITFKYYGALLIIEGEGKYIDCDKTEINIYPGCFIQRLPDRRHSTIIHSSSKWLETFVCFGRNLYDTLDSMGLITSSKPVLNPGIDQILLKSFLDLYNDMNDYSSEQMPFLLTKALDIVFLAHKLDETNKECDKNDIINRACTLIDELNGINITGSDVAQNLMLGYETFRKLFKAYVGISPNAYIIQARINCAKSLLLDSAKSINEIALNLGYPDQFSFSKQFRKNCCVSPSEFRNQF